MKKKPCFVDFPQHRSKKVIFCLNEGLLNVHGRRFFVNNLNIWSYPKVKKL